MSIQVYAIWLAALIMYTLSLISFFSYLSVPASCHALASLFLSHEWQPGNLCACVCTSPIRWRGSCSQEEVCPTEQACYPPLPRMTGVLPTLSNPLSVVTLNKQPSLCSLQGSGLQSCIHMNAMLFRSSDSHLHILTYAHTFIYTPFHLCKTHGGLSPHHPLPVFVFSSSTSSFQPSHFQTSQVRTSPLIYLPQVFSKMQTLPSACKKAPSVCFGF